MLSYRFSFQGTKILSSICFCHNKHNELERQSSIQKSQQDDRLTSRRSMDDGVMVQYWNEAAAVRKEKRQHSLPGSLTNMPDLLRALQSMKNFPFTFTEFYHLYKRREERSQIIQQKYLPRRVAVLRADLAAAHFLVRRGGSVRFLGQQEWVGYKESKKVLPLTYIPGIFIEAIKAEGTELYYEGLPNLGNLKHLTYLSLKNLATMNDWCMDWISKEYYMTLKHLDISGCENVTHRALSCFYRFECLETLNVEGIPDTVEFKLACLMLLEIMPHLDIKGIDLSIPEKIDLNEKKHISDSKKQAEQINS